MPFGAGRAIAATAAPKPGCTESSCIGRLTSLGAGLMWISSIQIWTGRRALPQTVIKTFWTPLDASRSEREQQSCSGTTWDTKSRRLRRYWGHGLARYRCCLSEHSEGCEPTLKRAGGDRIEASPQQ